MTEGQIVCEHRRLRRQCEVCDLTEEVAALTAERDALAKEREEFMVSRNQWRQQALDEREALVAQLRNPAATYAMAQRGELALSEVFLANEARYRELERAAEQAERERDALREALHDVENWLPALKPVGHDGDEDSGQCDESCQRCQYGAIEARIDAALAAPKEPPTKTEET